MKNRKFISLLVFFVSLAVLIFSGYKLIKYKLESDATNAQISALEEIADVEEVLDESDAPEEPAADSSEKSLYWKYLNTPLLSVNLSALKQENSDTVAWLQVLGTNINYPVVQASDNRFYLYHSFDRSYNRAGWVFLDYRNDDNLGDKNNIIYAHGRTDKTMFGSLRNLLTTSWINPPENYLIRTKTAESSSVWQIFSIYVIPTTSDYIETEFKSDAEFENFLSTMKARSDHDFATEVTTEDKVLTLSTCYDEKSRIVVHAKLLKSKAF